MNLGIAGFGFVGQAVFSSIRKPLLPIIYDPPLGLNGDLTECDVIFCCLPTPSTKTGQDLSIYEEFFDVFLKAHAVKFTETSPLFVIKSTILPERLKELSKKYQVKVVANPEFLNQNSAIDDFRHQRVVVLGGRADLCRRAITAYEEWFFLPGNPRFELCSIEEAYQLKYIHNIYHAYKVLFWNYVYEITGNHRKIFNMYSKVTGKTNEMEKICADGKLGFGGKCFPKDTKAFHEEYNHELTEFILNYNKKLRGEEDAE